MFLLQAISVKRYITVRTATKISVQSVVTFIRNQEDPGNIK